MKRILPPSSARLDRLELFGSITVAIYPEVEIKKYKGVEIEKISDEVTDEEVSEAIKGIQKKNARIVTVDREVKDGDHIVLDYKGFVGDESDAAIWIILPFGYP